MQNDYVVKKEMPKAVDRVYMPPFTSGRTRKIHCEHCGEDFDVDIQHVVYTIEMKILGTQKRIVLTFCTHTHKHRYLKAHPEVADYMDFGIDKKDLNKHPEWKKYAEKYFEE